MQQETLASVCLDPGYPGDMHFSTRAGCNYRNDMRQWTTQLMKSAFSLECISDHGEESCFQKLPFLESSSPSREFFSKGVPLFNKESVDINFFLTNNRK